jgi:hypothetical protein
MVEFQVTDSTSVDVEMVREGVKFDVIHSGGRVGYCFTEATFTFNDHQMDALTAWWAARKAEEAAATYHGA